MFKQLDLKVIGGIAFIAILLVAGVYLYSQWSYKRFASEIDAPLEPSTSSESAKSTEQPNSTPSPESVKKNLEVASKPTGESDPTNMTEDKEVSAEKTAESEFDATQLLPVLGLPEEVTSLLDGEAEAEDIEKAQAYLQEKYGQSPEVEAIMDRLKQMSGGPVNLEDVTALFEDWIAVLPEDQQENRQSLMRILTILQQNKGKDAKIYISTDGTGPDIDPSLLEGENVEKIVVTNTETIKVDE